MNKLDFPSPLIDPITLANLIGSPDLVLVDVRYSLLGPPGRPQYEAGHLPDAQYLDLDTELSGPPDPSGAGGRHPLPDPDRFQAQLRRIGVKADTVVVAYDGGTSQSAARLWWLLTDAGHERTHVLNGGFAAWLAARFPVETGMESEVKPGDFVVKPGKRERLDAAAVAAALGAGRPVVDVRAADRYAGENEIIDPVAGHIPGAISRPAADLLDAKGRFGTPAEIAGQFADLDDPVLYCGSGITAAQTLLALEYAGRTGVIYPGSWSDWISDPARPVATGPTAQGT